MAIDGNVLDSFFVALGFKVDKEGIEKFQQETEKLRNFALGIGAALTAAATGAALFVEEVAKGMGELQHFSETVHLNVLEIAAWNRVAAQNMVSSDAMESSIRGLMRATGQAASGFGRGYLAFKRYGLSAKDAQGHTKGFGAVLDEVSAKIQKQSAAQNQAMFQFLHIDPLLLPLLEKGSASVRKMLADAAAANPFTEEDYEQAKQLTVQFGAAERGVQTLYRMIAVKLFPVTSKILLKFIAWVKILRSDPDSGFNRGLRVMANFAERAWEKLSQLTDIAERFGSWLNTYVLPDWVTEKLPWLANIIIPALIVGFDLLAVAAARSLAIAVRAIIAFCATGIEWFTAFSVAELIALFPLYAIIAAVVALSLAAYEVYDHWDSIIEWFGTAWDWLFDQVQKVVDAVDAAWHKTKRFFGGDDSQTMSVIRQAVNSPSEPAAWNHPGGSNALWSAPSAYNNSRSVTQHITGTQITVLSPDPEKAGHAVQRVLKPGKTRTLIRNSQSGTVY